MDINNANVTLNGNASGDYFGASVAGAGDFNDDGYDDVIVGAKNHTSGIFSASGQAVIFYGGLDMDSYADVTIDGQGENYLFGAVVSAAGDVNNDGYLDIAIGATGVFDSLLGAGNLDSGKLFIYDGNQSNDGVADITISGLTNADFFSSSISSAGDLNSDGYADILAGATVYNQSGHAYAFHCGPEMDLLPDLVMNGLPDIGEDDGFGRSITSGDINGDGYNDIIAGDPLADGSGDDNGQIYIFFGGTDMNPEADLTISGTSVNGKFGISVQ
jgi:hypothetical protein